MKTAISIFLTSMVILLSAVTFPFSGNAANEEADKKVAIKIFKKYRCNECHTIAVAGIGENAATGEAENEEDEEEGEAIEPPDLSKVGDKFDAKWISGYLRKKNSIEGRKHKKRFKGKKEERQDLSLWLESLKSDSTETSEPDSKKSN